mmetsp:Transcript_10284/g.41860  ORF Transcript_10284/g.41860 Transcript_10284/m.41860 type:complete len:222 (+) Transcript_10284:390-1055(+)
MAGLRRGAKGVARGTECRAGSDAGDGRREGQGVERGRGRDGKYGRALGQCPGGGQAAPAATAGARAGDRTAARTGQREGVEECRGEEREGRVGGKDPRARRQSASGERRATEGRAPAGTDEPGPAGQGGGAGGCGRDTARKGGTDSVSLCGSAAEGLCDLFCRPGARWRRSQTEGTGEHAGAPPEYAQEAQGRPPGEERTSAGYGGAEGSYLCGVAPFGRS